jgi:hypothetical protein
MTVITLDGEECRVKSFHESTDYEHCTIRLVLVLEKNGLLHWLNPVLLLGKGVLSSEQELKVSSWSDKHSSGKVGYSGWAEKPFTVERFWVPRV